MKQFINKNLTKLILIGLAVFIIFQFKNYREEIHRNQDNLEQVLSDNNSKILKLTKREFKKQLKQQNDSLLKHLMDSLNLKPKHIVRTYKNVYHHHYDTTTTHLYPGPDGLKYFTHKFDNCLEISGHINYDLDSLSFDKTENKVESISAVVWNRKHKILGIRFGRKIYWMHTTNNCTGETTVLETEIVRE